MNAITVSERETPPSSTKAIEYRGGALGLRVRAIDISGARVTYVDEGEGPPVVLLHGAPLTSLGFVRVIRALRSRHRVIAPDLPGFGGSKEPQGFDGTLEAYASFVVDFSTRLGLSGFTMYVNDSSGCFGLAAAARMADKVAGLVVADTVPIPLTGAAWFVRIALRYIISSWLVRVLNRRFNLLPWLVVSIAPLLKPFTRNERRVLVREFDTAAKRDRVLRVFGEMGRDEAFMRESATAVADRLRAKPTLILFGQFDPMRLIGGARRFRALLPNSTKLIVPFEEHFPILASGDRVGRAVSEWLAREPALRAGAPRDA
jgi:haloalkane dehalogenase